ncbi:GEL1 protein [Peziza echinospora]|nr:GEL1 protein [Peziza echinospora]
MRAAGAIASLALLASTAVAQVTQPVTVKGNAFFVGDKRFYIRGVDYQPGGSSDLTDPLATKNCLRDIAIFKQLQINTIRVYTVDNSKDHTECMKALADAGIYLVLDVNTPKFSINREYPKESYNEIYLQHVFATADVFSQYINTLAFFAANEVANNVNTTSGMTYVKATIRDLKAYSKKQIKRQVPVGYSAADVAENRMQVAHYLNCGPAEERSDFHGVNDYSWCGMSSYTVSGWNQKVANFSDYSIPIFFSEYGCNQVLPRPFNEIETLYGTQMTPVFSGGLVYEYSNEANNYGLVQLNGNDSKVEPLQDFNNLKSMYEKVPLPTGDGGYKQNGNPSECPANTNDWVASETLPQMPAAASKYLESGAGAPRGTDGPSNQYIPGDGSKPSDTGTAGPVPKPTQTGGNGNTTTDKSSAARVGSNAALWASGLMIIVSVLGGALM